MLKKVILMKAEMSWFPSIILVETCREIRYGQYPESPCLLSIRSKWPHSVRHAKWAPWQRHQHPGGAGTSPAGGWQVTQPWYWLPYSIFMVYTTLYHCYLSLGKSWVSQQPKRDLISWLSNDCRKEERKEESHSIRLLNSSPTSNTCINI